MKIVALTGAGISKASGIQTFEENPELRNVLSRKFKNENPDVFNNIVDKFNETIKNVEPNDAHFALKEYDVDIITMNIDKLHQKAGSENVIELHGSYPNIVLYEDEAPEYQKAIHYMKKLPYKQFVFLIIGVSFYTTISQKIYKMAKQRALKVYIINNDAETRVRSICKNIK